jgi:hypothetical protein
MFSSEFRRALRPSAFGGRSCAVNASATYEQAQMAAHWPIPWGRVVAVAGVPADSTTIYFGAVSGGIWTAEDAGTVCL